MSNYSPHVSSQQDGADLAIDRWRGRVRRAVARATLGLAKAQTAERPTPERPRTVREAAAELGLSVYTVRAWISCRRLGHLRLGRAIRVPAAELRRVLEQSTVPAEQK